MKNNDNKYKKGRTLYYESEFQKASFYCQFASNILFWKARLPTEIMVFKKILKSRKGKTKVQNSLILCGAKICEIILFAE